MPTRSVSPPSTRGQPPRAAIFAVGREVRPAGRDSSRCRGERVQRRRQVVGAQQRLDRLSTGLTPPMSRLKFQVDSICSGFTLPKRRWKSQPRQRVRGQQVQLRRECRGALRAGLRPVRQQRVK
jgi:hypothetical protein